MFSGDSLFALQVGLDHALRRAAVLSFPGFGEEEAILKVFLGQIIQGGAERHQSASLMMPLQKPL